MRRPKLAYMTEDPPYRKNGGKMFSLHWGGGGCAAYHKPLSWTALSAIAKYSTDEIYVSYGLLFTPVLGAYTAIMCCGPQTF